MAYQQIPTRSPNDVITSTDINQLQENCDCLKNAIGRRNYLINGNFDMWQRGTSQTTSGYGSDDRWANSNVGSTKTHSQQTCTDTERALFNATYYSRTVVNSVSGSGNFVDKMQKIENVTLLAGKTVTLSFWARADGNKPIAVEFRQNFGSGGSPSSEVSSIGVKKFNLTTNWQRFTHTITIPSIVGKTLGTDGVHTTFTQLFIWFEAGSDWNSHTDNLGQQSGTFDLAQIKLEDGSQATEGWHPYDGEFGGEIEACLRYYETNPFQIFKGYIASGSYYWAYSGFKVMKRTTPTVVLTDIYNIGFPTGSPTTDYISIYGFGAYKLSNASSSSGVFIYSYTANAEL